MAELVVAKMLAERDAEIERLRALLAEAADILEGDGEYPETAKRLRRGLDE